MLKFGTPTIALPLAIKKCTVQTGCTVYIPYCGGLTVIYPCFSADIALFSADIALF